MTIIHPDGTETEISDQNAVAQAYRAVDAAAHRIGRNAAPKPGRFYRTYTPSAEHVLLVETLPKILSGEVSPEAAMALLHDPNVLAQRLNCKP